jgi:hypothetical protein
LSPLPTVRSSDPQMPAPRRKSGIRAVHGTVEEDFLARVRAVAAEPAIILPETLGDEAPAMAKLRRQLEKAGDGGSLPFSARFDKGLLGAVRAARELAAREGAPRLLDARVDGSRRFFLPHGHVQKLVCLGVQNHDDPLALLLAYAPMAMRHHLHFFAGPELWCTGKAPSLPPAWIEALADRTGIELVADADGAACPHSDRARVALRFRGGPSLRVCGACGRKAGNVHNHLIQRYACDTPSKPVDVGVTLAGGATVAVPEKSLEAYRFGKLDEEGAVEAALKALRKDATSGGAVRFVLGPRDFGSDQEAFLQSLGLADWEREPVRVLTAGGHVGSSPALSDILTAHDGQLEAAVRAVLGAGAAQFVARHRGTDTRTLLRLAHDAAERDAKTRDMPTLRDLGPIGTWMDGFARDARTLDRAQLMNRVRRDVAEAAHPAHLYAFLTALGLAGEAERAMSADQKDAGRHWAPLAKAVLEASGPAYAAAIEDYLRQTGAGEGA